jgi:hypothetical protein
VALFCNQVTVGVSGCNYLLKDFKSLASTSSATPASLLRLITYSIIQAEESLFMLLKQRRL